jgi:hypothetical protein
MDDTTYFAINGVDNLANTIGIGNVTFYNLTVYPESYKILDEAPCCRLAHS